MSWRHAALAVAATLCACGDPMPAEDYAGEALLERTGRIFIRRPPGEEVAEGRMVLLWWDVEREGFVVRATQEVALSLTEAFPAFYTLRLFQPPPAEARVTLEGDDTPVAAALIALYADRDGDGRYDPEVDRLIGGNASFAVTWATRRVEASASPSLFWPMEGGYQVHTVLGDGCPSREELQAGVDVGDEPEGFVFRGLGQAGLGSLIDLFVEPEIEDPLSDLYMCPNRAPRR